MRSQPASRVSCASLAEEGVQGVGYDGHAGCCPSCHHDEEEGYASMSEVDLKDGRQGVVCCAVALDLGQRGFLA